MKKIISYDKILKSMILIYIYFVLSHISTLTPPANSFISTNQYIKQILVNTNDYTSNGANTAIKTRQTAPKPDENSEKRLI